MSNVPPPPPSGGGFPPPPSGGFPPPAGGPPPGAPGALAEWQDRLVSGLIDYVGPYIVIGVISVPITLASSSDGVFRFSIVSLLLGLLPVAWALYQGHLAGTTGQSMGMKQSGLRLVGETTGQPIGSSQGLVRNALFAAAYVLNVLCCGILGTVLIVVDSLFPLWDPKKQTLRDKIAKAVVVKG